MMPAERRMSVGAALAHTAGRLPVRMLPVEPRAPFPAAPAAVVCPFDCPHYTALMDALDELAQLRAWRIEREGRALNHRRIWADDTTDIPHHIEGAARP